MRRAETRPRAEFEAVNERARRELAETEDAGVRRAIMERHAEDIRTLLGVGVKQTAGHVADAATTNFGQGVDAKESVKLQREMVNLLRKLERKDNVAVMS